APVLAQLLPELGVLPAAAMDSPTKEKLRLQSTITDVLAALGAAKPLVVILEDWQWSDALSRELMDYLLRNLKSAPVLFLITTRELAPAEAAGTRVVPLEHLDEAGVARMITSMLGTQDVGERFLQEVAGLSKGSPFFVEKLLEHLVQNQILVNHRGRWNTDVELATERLPKNLKGLLMWRITCLSEATQEVAHVGAVMGRVFTIDMLKRVAAVPDDVLFAAVEALCQSQVFVPGADGAYCFAQDQIQELLYANIAPPSKRRLHTAVVEALEAALGGVPLPEAPLELVTALAQHALNGEAPDKTIVYALEAGLRNAALFANAEAERFLQAGLAAARVHHTPEAWLRHKLDYMSSLADVWRLTGKSDRAHEAYLEAIALAETLGDRARVGRMLTHLGRCHQVLGRFPQALDCCERALTLSREFDDLDAAIRTQIQMGRIRLFMGDLPRATEHAESALSLARETGDSTKIGEALGILGYFYVASGSDKLADGVAFLAQSQACLSVMGDWIALVTTLNFLGTAQNMLGDHLDAWHSFQQHKKICYEVGMKDEEVFANLNLAITAYELGEFPEMGRLAGEATAIAGQLNSRYPRGMARTLHAVALANGTKPGEATAMLAEALALARELQHKYMQTQVLLYQMQVLVHLGQLPAARAAADELAELIAETGDREPESRLYVAMAEILGRTGDLDGARGYADRARLAALAAHAKGMQVRALAIQAWLALANGHHQEVRTIAKDGLAISTRIGSKALTAQLYLALGEASLATGQEGAAEAFDLVEAIADEVASPVLRAHALFGQAAARPHSGHAHVLAAEARDLLEDFASGLEPAARDAFFGLKERARIVEGDFQAFSRTISGDSRTSPGQPPRLGLDPGMWKML
ncbi:MAG: guanylate cyclase, partial [Cyanobacteria bacterium RYN_339]|nr:guanylate cyclase [Cyanobacteria bacterium RYN_339]